MKSRGFTLVEMLGIIIIIGVLAVIAVPIINVIIKSYKDNAYQKQISLLEEEANKWSIANTEYLPEKSGDIIFVNLEMLIDDGYITNTEIKDPRNNKELNGCITITKDEENNQYNYKYNDKTCDSLIEGYAPTFTVKGEYKNTIEVNTDFEEFDVVATSNKGTELKLEGPIIKKNNQVVNEVTTSKVGDKFTLRYKAYDPNYGYTYTKDFDVTVVDTKKPILTFAEDSGIVNDNGTYKIEVNQKDTTFKAPIPKVTDNSCGKSGTDTNVNSCDKTLTVKTRGLYNVNVVDDYEYTYYATDSSGNEGAIVLHIIVVDKEPPEIAVTSSTSEWVLSGIELTINATDNIGLASSAYSFDNGVNWQTSNKKIYNSASTINIKVKDVNGNISSKTVVIEGRTEYGYQNVASWSSSYSTTAPSDGYYKSKTQYKVTYKKTVWNSCCSQSCPTVNFNNTGTCAQNQPYITCHEWSGGGCAASVCSSGTRKGSCSCVGCNQTTSGTTGWQDSNSAPSGTTYVSSQTRTVYAAPSSWGASTGWTTSGAYSKTTSRKPVTRTTIHYKG